MLEQRLVQASDAAERLAKELRALAATIHLEASSAGSAPPWCPESPAVISPTDNAIPALTTSETIQTPGYDRYVAELAAKLGAVRIDGPVARRKEDTLVRLEDFGHIAEGTVIRLIRRMIPADSQADDPRFRATIDRNPAKPIWNHSGRPVRSLTSLSKELRDAHRVPLPASSFNPCLYWCIEGESPERTLADIAQQLVR